MLEATITTQDRLHQFSVEPPPVVAMAQLLALADGWLDCGDSLQIIAFAAPSLVRRLDREEADGHGTAQADDGGDATQSRA